MSGTTLNWHIVESLALLPPEYPPPELLDQYARLAFADIQFSADALRLTWSPTPTTSARAPHERLRLAALFHAAIAATIGLSLQDLSHVFAECDYPLDSTATRNPKGFWRVDKDRPPELRQAVLTLLAFESLLQYGDGDPQQGMANFLTQDGDGWLIPETVRLADYGLGHDDRAKRHQPVASRLGPRFYDWQLAQTADEALRERHLHARNLLGELDYARLLRDVGRTAQEHTDEPLRQVAEPRAKYHGIFMCRRASSP